MAALYNTFLQPQNINGVPLAGAKLYFYVTATTTPITIYQDSALGTPHANPVVADSSGIFAPIYVNQAIYKTLLTTSADVTVQTVDPVNSDATLTGTVLTLPQINDTTGDHQYVVAVNELSADRTVTLPLLLASDTFVFANHIQTLVDKTFTNVTGYLLAGLLHGLTISNNVADATNDIDIAIGSAASIDTVPVLMSLTTALTKRLDATFVVGTNQGMLDTGAIGNNIYHMFIIRRPDTGVVDILASLSATAPTMPTNYTQKRRIASIVRAGATITPFYQNGDVFMRVTPISDRNSTAAAASALLTVSVPSGIVCAPLFTIALNIGAGDNTSIALGSVAIGSANITVSQEASAGADTNDITAVPPVFFTNTNSQIYFAQTNSAGTPTSSTLFTYGWVDQRGREY